jgi:excisionase family DNA binding protein
MATGSMNNESASPPQNGFTANHAGTPAPALLDIEQLAAWLRVDVGFLRRLVAKRRIPFVKLGKFVRFDPDEIAGWIDGQRVRAEEVASRRVDWRN